MKKIILFISIIFTLNLFAFEPHFMSDPAISPDGEEICFVYKSDLWVVSYSGGEAKRITDSEGSNWNPQYSPDGKSIAFNTNRDGWTAIYKLPSDGGKAIEISKEDLTLIEWFPNGKELLTDRDDPNRKGYFYRLKLNGFYERITGFANSYATISPDGKEIAFNRRGLPYREAYEGSHNGDLWLYNINEDKYKRLTLTPKTERYPKFSKSGEMLYFAYSDGQVFQLCKANIDNLNDRKILTNFSKWSVRDIDLAKENDRIVFEKFDELWIYDPLSSKTHKLQIEIKQDVSDKSIIREDVKNKFDKFCISHDGKLLVFSYKFDLFAVPEAGDKVLQITHDQKGIRDIIVSNDNHTIIFVSYEKGKPQLFRVDVRDINNIEKIPWSDNKYIESIDYAQNTLIVSYSQDDKYYRLAIGDSLGENVRPLVTDKVIFSGMEISEDKKYAFFIESIDEIWSNHLYCYDLKNHKQKIILSDENYLGRFALGKDGKTAFVTRDGEINRIDLIAKEDFFDKEDHWKEILMPEPSKKKTNNKEIVTKIDFENISKRVKPIVNRSGYNYIVHVINDSSFYYVNNFNDEMILRKNNYLGKHDEKICKLPKKYQNMIYNEENKCFYVISEQKLFKIDPQKKKTEMIKNEFKYRYDQSKLDHDIFLRVWTEFGKGFYDPQMHNVNWEKLKRKYTEYLSYINEPQSLKAIIDEMIGEVNASHTGYYLPDDNHHKKYRTAYLGCEFDFDNYPKEGIRVSKVYNKSKLNKPHKINAGDILYSIDGKIIGKENKIISLLKDKIKEEISLVFKIDDDLKKVTIKGLDFYENYLLYYDDWVDERIEIVDKRSNGKIGYMHIRGMGWRSLQKFKQELYTKNLNKKALIIDVRNNGGGYTHDSLVEILTKKSYALSSSRIFGANIKKTPGRKIEVPMIVLINENSYSDAEIFPTLIQELNLGKVVGMPTSGSVIGTGFIRFMDGSGMRMPSHGWYTLDRKNMEGNGVIPDIKVEPTPKQIISDDDIQLKVAIEKLLKEID